MALQNSCQLQKKKSWCWNNTPLWIINLKKVYYKTTTTLYEHLSVLHRCGVCFQGSCLKTKTKTQYLYFNMNVKGHSYCTSAKSITFACPQHLRSGLQHAYSEYVKCLCAGASKNIWKPQQSRPDLTLKNSWAIVHGARNKQSRSQAQNGREYWTGKLLVIQKFTQLSINDWQHFDRHTLTHRNQNTALKIPQK